MFKLTTNSTANPHPLIMDPTKPTKPPVEQRRRALFARYTKQHKCLDRSMLQFIGVYLVGLGTVFATGYGIYQTGYMLYNKYSKK